MATAVETATSNPIRVGDYAEPHVDLRDWLQRVEGIGQLKRVKRGPTTRRPSCSRRSRAIPRISACSAA
jgi:hypothetical protein